MIKAKVSPSGQITIPQRIRRFLSLKKGDRIIFTELPDGTVLMKRDDENSDDDKSEGEGKSEKNDAGKKSGTDDIPYWYFI